MRRRALAALLSLVACACASPPAQVADPEAPAEEAAGPGDVGAAVGYLHLAAAGDETRYEAGWASLDLGLRPWAVAPDPGASGELQAGLYGGFEVLRFSSRSYSGTRASPALGLDLLWTHQVLDWDLLYTLTLRPHVAGSFERSRVSDAVGDEDRDTVLLAVDLLASAYWLSAPPDSRVAWFPETHLRAVLEHDLAPARYAADRSGVGLVAAPARRTGGVGGAAVTPGSAALEGDRRDLGRVLVEVTQYAARLDMDRVELALGLTAGVTRTRAYYYLGLDDGDPVHSLYAGPLLRVRATPGLWLIAACPLLVELETDRWGPTPSLTLLWAF